MNKKVEAHQERDMAGDSPEHGEQKRVVELIDILRDTQRRRSH